MESKTKINIDLRLGDCLEVLKTIPDNSVDSVVTDPPYGIGFMNKEWDNPQKHIELIERETKRSLERFDDGKSPVKGGFSKGVQPGLPIGGAKEGKWFQDWCEIWARECYRILKPGGHALSFSAPRTYHRMATAFEDSGFQIRDQIMWVFGSGFPKSHNIGKAIDKIEGNEREVVGEKKNKINLNATKEGDKSFYENAWQNKDYVDLPITKGNSEWEGWGTALKPAHEPIVMARKPLSEKSIAENVLKHGTGGINIDGSRIDVSESEKVKTEGHIRKGNVIGDERTSVAAGQFGDGAFVAGTDLTNGRFPANIIFDEEAGQLLDEQSGKSKTKANKNYKHSNTETESNTFTGRGTYTPREDEGGASRFFYCPKTSKKDRNEGLVVEKEKNKRPIGVAFNNEDDLFQQGTGNNHPTVKPTDLMRYLINLVTPPNGTTLDPFMGSGSTGKAAIRCGVNFIGIEKEQEYMDIAKARIEHEQNKPVQQSLF
jgi:site-specific DNA-methyltransferase (adenine-specific)